MQFFLYEIVARIVAIYFCVDCFRTLRCGLVERKIKFVNTNTGILDWLLDWGPRPIFHRDTAPVRYWMEMSTQTLGLLGCLIVAIFGWWQPNA
jgi:hypothetical protein